MRIAFVISETLCLSEHNGIKIQAETWADEIERQGHIIVKVNPWDEIKWEKFDAIHFIGYSSFLRKLYLIQSRNSNIIFSPIIDTKQGLLLYKMASFWGCHRLRLESINYIIRRASKYIRHWVARSDFESQYIVKSYDISPNHVSVIPLSYRINPPINNLEKENFCLHVSALTDERKNVFRLIKAAEKYGFRLLLGGTISSEKKYLKMKECIDRNDNIDYIGEPTDEELVTLYSRAKVFALPSINEGVGMVALEAAVCGCNIVITNVGGPKEYYRGNAYEVDPMDVDSIGKAVMTAMKDSTHQPQLSSFVREAYNLEKCVSQLIKLY